MNATDATDAQLLDLFYSESIRRETARETLAETDRNLSLIHAEIQRRQAAVAQTNGRALEEADAPDS